MKYYVIFLLNLLMASNAHAIFTTYQQLLNGAAKSMAVNGGTPQVFTYSPGGGNTVRVRSLSVLLEKTGNTAFNKFATLTALTNGVLIQYTSGGTTKTLATIKDNADLTNVFSDMQHFGNGAVLTILSAVTPEGFGNSNNLFRGKLILHSDLLLTGSDSFSTTIQDNLSTLGTFEMGLVLESDN